jgi:hypothetical protein
MTMNGVGHYMGYLMLGIAYDYAQVLREISVAMVTENNAVITDGLHVESDTSEQVYFDNHEDKN